ncbi:unnamed protein product [Musa hybrid cultivar]
MQQETTYQSLISFTGLSITESSGSGSSHGVFHSLGDAVQVNLQIRNEALLRPRRQRVAVERPLQLAPALVAWQRHRSQRRDVAAEPHVVLRHLVAVTPADGVERQQFLRRPEGRIATVVAGRAGAVADAAGLPFGARDHTAVDRREPQVNAAEAGEEGPGFVSLGAGELGGGFAFPPLHLALLHRKSPGKPVQEKFACCLLSA